MNKERLSFLGLLERLTCQQLLSNKTVTEFLRGSYLHESVAVFMEKRLLS